MTRDVRTVNEEDELVDVAELFRTLSIRRLVVMRGDQVVGILSRRDLIWHALKLRGHLPRPQAVVS